MAGWLLKQSNGKKEGDCVKAGESMSGGPMASLLVVPFYRLGQSTKPDAELADAPNHLQPTAWAISRMRVAQGTRGPTLCSLLVAFAALNLGVMSSGEGRPEGQSHQLFDPIGGREQSEPSRLHQAMEMRHTTTSITSSPTADGWLPVMRTVARVPVSRLARHLSPCATSDGRCHLQSKKQQ
ncbi:hypothetical protein BKA80DRAFT_47135 [Phyllosticta citrichinensis]